MFFQKKKYKNKLLIMNWSFSEIPLNGRNKFENMMYNFNYIIISFQDKFEEINNINYFNNLKNKLKDNKYDVKIEKIITMKFSSRVNHYYFFAKR